MYDLLAPSLRGGSLLSARALLFEFVVVGSVKIQKKRMSSPSVQDRMRDKDRAKVYGALEKIVPASSWSAAVSEIKKKAIPLGKNSAAPPPSKEVRHQKLMQRSTASRADQRLPRKERKNLLRKNMRDAKVRFLFQVFGRHFGVLVDVIVANFATKNRTDVYCNA